MIERFRLPPFDDIYWLGGEVRPGSVRDAVWRAGTLVEELARRNGDLENIRVLVVGAGVSGMSAACHALGAGAHVTHCERRPASYSPFENCYVKRLCPTTADFPRKHFDVGRFPHRDGIVALLEWTADSANNVFTQISDQFEVLSACLQDQYVRYNDACIELLEQRPNEEIVAKIAGYPPERFDIAILTTGIGPLRRRIADNSLFEGYTYFDNDPIFVTRMPADRRPRVLLVGGGDGSLADFVRLVTGAVDIALELKSVIPDKKIRKRIEVLARYMWESYVMSPTESHSLHVLHDQLQMQMIDLIDQLWKRATMRDWVRKLVEKNPRPRPHVQICLECCHFGFSYLANRVLAQLISRYLASDRDRENGGLHPFRIGVAVENIGVANGSTHQCLGSPNCKSDCAQHPHEVYFAESYCKTAQLSQYLKQRRLLPDASYQTFTEEFPGPVSFDRILMRNGAKFFDDDCCLPANIQLACENIGGPRWQVPPFYLE